MFGKNLESLRKKKGISQEKLAQALDVSRQTIYLWEAGEKNPDATKLLALKNLFGVSVDKLLTAKNPEELENSDENSAREIDQIADEKNREKYEKFYKNFALAAAVCTVIFGSGIVATALMAQNSADENSPVVAFPVLLALAISIPTLIYFFLCIKDVKKLARKSWFSAEDRVGANKILAVKICVAIAIFTIGIVWIVLNFKPANVSHMTPEIAIFLMLMWISFGLIFHGIIARRKFVVREKNPQKSPLANILRALIFFLIFLPALTTLAIFQWLWTIYVIVPSAFLIVFMSPIVQNLARLSHYKNENFAEKNDEKVDEKNDEKIDEIPRENL